MSNIWQTTTVANLGRVVTGKTPPTSKAHLYGVGYPFITPTDIDGYRNCEPSRQLSEEGRESQRNLLLPAKSICVTCIASIGKMCVTDRPSFTNQQINSIVVDIARYDPFFVYYLLQTRVEHLKSIAGGAATPIVNKTTFSEIEVTVPPLPVQRRIASILSAYDELIENSQRRIKILEAMARGLYREWFVHFRFPGHENHPRAASALGEIPQGWEVKLLGDLIQFKSGFAFKSGTFTVDGEHRLVTIKNVQDGSFNPESDSRMASLPERLPSYCILNDGDILLSLTGNVGRVCVVFEGPFLLNQRVAKLVPVDTEDWALTYCMFRDSEMRTKLEMLSNGVAQQNLSPVLASQMEFVCPPQQLREQFSTFAKPMLKSIVGLYVKVQNLRRTRDLLLPRLLSGQIDLMETFDHA